jgi:predicted protein tyrosine phosphatase
MTRFLLGLLGPLLVLACVAAPVAEAVREQRQFKKFHVVRPGVLYRSGQTSVSGLRRIVHDHRIRTVISLREGTDARDLAEERFCAQEEIRFVRLTPVYQGWDGQAGNSGNDENVRTFLEVMSDPANHPVLVHCFAGIHRTGAYCAVYRMEFEGWDNEQAIAEVKAMGYDNFDNEMDIRGWLEGYRPGRIQTGAPLDDAVSAVDERRRRLADQIKPGMAAEEVDRLIGDEETGGFILGFMGRTQTSYHRLGPLPPVHKEQTAEPPLRQSGPLIQLPVPPEMRPSSSALGEPDQFLFRMLDAANRRPIASENEGCLAALIISSARTSFLLAIIRACQHHHQGGQTPIDSADATASAEDRIRPGMPIAEVERIAGPGQKPLPTGGIVGGVAITLPSTYPGLGVLVHWRSEPGGLVVDSVESLESPSP